MHALKETRKYIERNPETVDAQVLSQLVLALENQSPFKLAAIYDLREPQFRLALHLIEEWKLDRHYASKSKLYDLSTQLEQLTQSKTIPRVIA